MFINGYTSGYEVVIMEERLTDILQEAESVAVYHGGGEKTYPSGSPDYERLMSEVKKLTRGAREMPAFGVALNDLTEQAKRENTAIEFRYGSEREHNGMGFSKLFVRVEPEYYGVNLERYTDGKYQGRSFYLNLERSAAKLYELVSSL